MTVNVTDWAEEIKSFLSKKKLKSYKPKNRDVSPRKVQNILRSPAAKRIRIVSPIKSPIEFRKYLAISEISIFSPVSYKRQRTTSTPKVHGEPNKNIDIKRQLQYENGKSTCAFTESETVEDSFAAEFN